MDDLNQPLVLPHDKSELFVRIQQERQALEQTIGGLSEAEMTQPGPEEWSIKDHLAHIVIWEQILLVAEVQGRPFAEAAQLDAETAAATRQMTAEEGLNDYFYQRDKHKSLAAVLADFQSSYRQVLATLENVEFASLALPLASSSKTILESVANNTYEHYAEHRTWITGILQSQLSHQ